MEQSGCSIKKKGILNQINHEKEVATDGHSEQSPMVAPAPALAHMHVWGTGAPAPDLGTPKSQGTQGPPVK